MKERFLMREAVAKNLTIVTQKFHGKMTVWMTMSTIVMKSTIAMKMSTIATRTSKKKMIIAKIILTMIGAMNKNGVKRKITMMKMKMKTMTMILSLMMKVSIILTILKMTTMMCQIMKNQKMIINLDQTINTYQMIITNLQSFLTVM